METVEVPLERPQGPSGELIEKADGRRDEWEGERLNALVGPRLELLARLLESHAPLDDAALADLVAADGAAFPTLAPTELETVFGDGPFEVRLWRRPDGARLERIAGIEGARRALEGLRARLGDGVHVELEPLLVPRAVHLRVLASGHHDREQVQVDARWTTDWTLPDEDGEGGVQLLGIEVEGHEEARLAADTPLFRDATPSVLAGEPRYRSQLLPSLRSWGTRLSRLEGFSDLGFHGIAVGDVDGDGLEDLYVCDAAGLPNRLFVHRPDGTVRDVAHEAGVDWLEHSAGALLVDVDDDGDPDLVVATRAGVLLAENDGQGHFELRRQVASVGDPVSLAAADYDADGDLDFFVCNYRGEDVLELPGPMPLFDARNGGRNLLLRHDRDHELGDVTAEAGLAAETHFSLAAAWEDYDDDGDLDLYVVNDFGPNDLYRNDGGRFTEVARQAGAEDRAAGASISWGDFDHDGWMDAYVGNAFSSAGLRITSEPRFANLAGDRATSLLERFARGNTLLANASDGSFADVSLDTRATMGRHSWAAAFADVDNDGWQDLLVANGFLTNEETGDLGSFFWRQVARHAFPRDPDATASWSALRRLVDAGWSWSGREPNVALLNLHGRRFADVSALTGIDFADDGRTIVPLDWDLDGDLDLWIGNRSGPRLRFLRNRTDALCGERSFVALRLRGTHSNRDGIGARVELLVDDPALGRLVQTARAGGAFLSQSSRWLHFGLGTARSLRGVSVRWPGGPTESFSGVEPGSRFELVEGTGTARPWSAPVQRLAIAPGEPPAAEPPPDTVRLNRVPMPRLTYATLDGASEDALRDGAQATLLVLWASWSDACVRELRALGGAAASSSETGLDVVALAVDGLDARHRTGPADARSVLDELGLPFRAGLATGELLRKLDLVEQVLFGRRAPLAVPTSYLFDTHGALVAIRRGPLDVEALQADLRALAPPLERWRPRTTPFAGRWLQAGTAFDASSLAEAFRADSPADAEHLLRGAVRGRASLVEDDPAARPLLADARTQLAALLLVSERDDEAESELRKALELAPDWVPARRSLAALLRRAGRVEEAIAELRAALVARPGEAGPHDDLGSVLQASGLLAEAIAEYREALRLEPEHEPAHRNLRGALREGLRMNGSDPALMVYLAWELVRDDDPESARQAIELGQRACEITTFQDARALDVLAAAHWAAGHQRKALRTARRALRLATSKQPDQVEGIQARLQRYEQASGPVDGSPEDGGGEER